MGDDSIDMVIFHIDSSIGYLVTLLHSSTFRLNVSAFCGIRVCM